MITQDKAVLIELDKQGEPVKKRIILFRDISDGDNKYNQYQSIQFLFKRIAARKYSSGFIKTDRFVIHDGRELGDIQEVTHITPQTFYDDVGYVRQGRKTVKDLDNVMVFKTPKPTETKNPLHTLL